ncbi:MAG: KpsF/GutQ family sugar-phosphate isomerase [Alphaproteobacteria bacterium]|nr:KpsF/GutQ family sugar-phosphate isomerase [Alphaproteobacteria bacterium]
MSEIIATAKRVIAEEIEGLKQLSAMLDKNFETMVDKLINIKPTGRVIITGMGKPGHITKKIEASLASTGTPTFYVHPGEASHGDLGKLCKDDIIIMLSNSGESQELGAMINFAKRHGIFLIGWTAKPNSTLGEASDLLIKIPDIREACTLDMAPTVSTTMFLALGDALTVVLMDQRRFTKEDFRACHPGGKLGKIMKVQDLMWSGAEALALCRPEDKMSEALPIMSKKNVGCLIVTDEKGKIAGIITDGDLKRHISDKMMSLRAKEIMTKNPVVATSGMLASEALLTMEEKDITVLPVVNDMKQKKPIGVLHIRSILQSRLV